MSIRIRFVIAACAVTMAAGLVHIPFDNQPSTRLSPDIDGPWPTLRLDYSGGSGENLTLNTYLTFANASLLIRPHTCADAVADGTLRCGEFSFPQFYLDTPTMKQVELPALKHGHEIDLIPWGNISLNDGRTGLDFCRFMSFDGNITGANFTSNLRGHHIETPAVVGEKFATRASNVSLSVPLLNSMMSLPRMVASLLEARTISSQFSGFHMGSIEPLVNGSLVIGGYDNNKVMGDLLSWTETYNSYGNPNQLGSLTLTHIYIGAESGFLPLENLKLNNDSFPQGPYKQEPGFLRENINITATQSIIIEPGTPYIHLSQQACDSLAELLDLEYDATRNLYLWTYPPDHPIFKSPVYLELLITSTSISDVYYAKAAYPEVSIKIPMASLQHTFHATTRTTNGSLLPPARYFPCSRSEYEWNGGLATWPRLGRAFLQSAFLASSFKYNDTADTVADYWLAQAPGPEGIGGNSAENLIEVASGTITNRTGVILEADAWTRSWSSLLPIWTLDFDGVTTLEQLNAISETPHQSSLGVKVAVPIVGTSVILLALFFGVKGIHRSRVNNARIKREIGEEDATAREIERLSLLKYEKRESVVPRDSSDDQSINRHSLSVSSLSDDEPPGSESEHEMTDWGRRVSHD